MSDASNQAEGANRTAQVAAVIGAVTGITSVVFFGAPVWGGLLAGAASLLVSKKIIGAAFKDAA